MSALETAAATIAATLASEVPGALVSRFPFAAEPEDFGDSDDYPDGTQVLIAVLDGGPLAAIEGRSRGSARRPQEARLAVRFWVYENGAAPALSQAFIAQRRAVLDAIETVFLAQTWSGQHWKADWDGSAISLEAEPPYAAGEITITVTLHE